VKRKLMGYLVESESELLSGVGVIAAEIRRDFVNAVLFLVDGPTAKIYRDQCRRRWVSRKTSLLKTFFIR
jgi:hypothetical protein